MSAAGMMLFGNSGTGAGLPGEPQESEAARKKRLQALQATRSKLEGTGTALSPAGMALNLNDYGI